MSRWAKRGLSILLATMLVFGGVATGTLRVNAAPTANGTVTWNANGGTYSRTVSVSTHHVHTKGTAVEQQAPWVKGVTFNGVRTTTNWLGHYCLQNFNEDVGGNRYDFGSKTFKLVYGKTYTFDTTEDRSKNRYAVKVIYGDIGRYWSVQGEEYGHDVSNGIKSTGSSGNNNNFSITIPTYDTVLAGLNKAGFTANKTLYLKIWWEYYTAAGNKRASSNYIPVGFEVKYEKGTYGTFANKTCDPQYYGSAAPNPGVDLSYSANNDWYFAGWKSSIDGTVYATNALPVVTNNVTYTAQWKPTVTFKDRGTTLIDHAVVDIGGTATPPDMTNRYPGHTFQGWDSNGNGYAYVNVTKPVTCNAMWDVDYYWVRYKPGDRGAFAEESEATQAEFGKSTPAYSGPKGADGYPLMQAGWKFTGWNPEVTATVTGPATYIAQAEQISYTIRFTPGDHGNFVEQIIGNKHYGDVLTPLNATTASPQQWRFIGWKLLPAGDVYQSNIPSVIGNATYEAQWEEIFYTIGYSNSGLFEFDNIDYEALAYNSSTPDAPVVSDNPAYHFVGWSPTQTEKVTTNVIYYAMGETHLRTTETVEPTCTITGHKTTYCTKPGCAYDAAHPLEGPIVLDALGHDWGAWETEREETLELAGLERRVCQRDASHTEEREISHTCVWETSQVIVADCEHGGYTKEHCSTHNHDRIVNETPKIDHDWNDWITITPPTCLVAGEKRRVCKRYENHTESGTIPAIGHNYEATVMPPDCEGGGFTAYVCRNDADHTKTDSYTEPTGHAWGGWVVTTSPGLDIDGEETRICNNNHAHTEMRIILTMWHRGLIKDEIYWFANDPTHFGPQEKGYNMLETHVKYLQSRISILEGKASASYANLATALAGNLMPGVQWQGSCYGMAVTTLLDKNNQINFKKNFGGGAESMNKVPSPIQNAMVESAINYYMMSQIIPALQSTETDFALAGTLKYRDTLASLVENAQKSKNALFGYLFDRVQGGKTQRCGHAIVVLGYGGFVDGKHVLAAYDNRYPDQDTIIEVAADFSSCVVLAKSVEVVAGFYARTDLSRFNAIDLDGPKNDMVLSDDATYLLRDELEHAKITFQVSTDDLTIRNANGETLVYNADTGQVSGNMKILRSSFIVGATTNGEPAPVTFAYDVADSSKFQFDAKEPGLEVAIVSEGLFASASSDSADQVVVEKGKGVSVTGDGLYDCRLGLGVNNGACDLLQMNAKADQTASLQFSGNKVVAMADYDYAGSVTFCSDTVNVNTKALAKTSSPYYEISWAADGTPKIEAAYVPSVHIPPVINLGSNFTLYRKSDPGFAAKDTSGIDWVSSNPKILAIDNNGKVTFGFAAIGSVTITAIDNVTKQPLDSVTVKVTWQWWQWILVVLAFGWLYL